MTSLTPENKFRSAAVVTRTIRFLCLIIMVSSGCGDSGGEAPFEGLASVVFDIDGTLTTGIGALDFFLPRPDAAEAVQLYVEKGYGVIYLTARPWFLRDFTQRWLSQNGFPDLPLYLAEEILLDTPDRTVAYKLQVLRDLTVEEDRKFLYGYGDSSTDFDAYNQAGIPVSRTFALLRRGETDCEEGLYEACLPGYTEHLAYIEDQPNR